MNVASKEETDKAITAVKHGLASKEQEHIAARAAHSVGERGNRAREAFRKK